MAFEVAFQSAFVGGELSPQLSGRIDLARYREGAEELLNVVVLAEGGAARRPGTIHVAPVKFFDKFTRLVPFQVSEVLSYVLEVGEGYIRFHIDHATVIDGRAIVNGTFDTDLSGWTDGSTGTGAVAWNAGRADLSGGTSGVGLIHQARVAPSANNFYTVTVDVFGGTVQWAVGTTAGGNEIGNGTVAVGADQTFQFQTADNATIYLSFGNDQNDTRQIDNVRISSPIYELLSPYQEADLDRLKWAQTSTALYLVQPDWAPRRLRRIAVNQWELAVLDFVDGPYLDLNPDKLPTTTLTPSATTGSVTVNASTVDDINDGQGFLATDSGRVLRLDNVASGTQWGWAVITAVGSPTSVTVEVRQAFATTNATRKWRLGAWSNTTGWPQAVSFFEQRLVFANSELEPDRFWTSKTGTPQIETFSPSGFDGVVADNNAITQEIADDKQNDIVWLSAGDELAVGTVSSEIVVRSDRFGAPITPTETQAKRRTTRGSDSFRQPLRIDDQVLHVQRAGRRIREFRYDSDIEGYVSQDLSIIARHLTQSRVFDMAYQQEPYSVVWAARGDGRLIGLTYEREQEVLAWHQHTIGGALGSGNAVVDSLAAVPTPDQGADELWMIVVRTVNATTVRYVEYLTQPFDSDDMPQQDMYFVDGGLAYDGAPASTFAGLDHLEGETVSVLADGAVHPDVTVSGGQITLQRAAAKVAVGKRYISRIVPMPVEAAGAGGPAQGRVKAIAEVRVRFLDTLGCKYGTRISDEDGTRENFDDRLPFRRGGDLMDNPVPIFTGYKYLNPEGGFGRDARPVIEQDQPLAMTVLALSYGVSTDD